MLHFSAVECHVGESYRTREYILNTLIIGVLDMFSCSRIQPENSTSAAETCRSLLFVMNYILLSVFVGWYIDCQNVHGENDMK
jgi:hypothetical protein